MNGIDWFKLCILRDQVEIATYRMPSLIWGYRLNKLYASQRFLVHSNQRSLYSLTPNTLILLSLRPNTTSCPLGPHLAPLMMPALSSNLTTSFHVLLAYTV